MYLHNEAGRRPAEVGGQGSGEGQALEPQELGEREVRERCGRSEHAHAIMKSDLAGGKLPSALFGANAAWSHSFRIARTI